MKTVFNAEMVAHLWANRHAHNVRTSSGNLYTRGGALFSYGEHYIVGAFLDTPAKGGRPLLLWNDGKYSVTTARHSSHAWRALAPAQRAASGFVPELSADDISDHAALANLAHKTMRAAVPVLEKAKKARTSRAWYLEKTRQYLETARALFQYVGDDRAAANVPECPAADTGAIVAALAMLNRADYLASAAAETKRAADELARALGMIDAGAFSSARAMYQRIAHAQTVAKRARGFYDAAQQKPPRALATLARRIETLRAEWQPRADAETLAADAREIAECVPILRAHLRKYRQSRRANDARGNRAAQWQIERFAEKLRDALGSGPDSPEWSARVAALSAHGASAETIAQAWHALKRWHRIDAARILHAELENAAKNARDVIAGNGATLYGYTIDGRLRRYAAAVERGASYWRARVAEVETLRESARVASIARAAEKIEAWRRGESVRLPDDVPTMVRVVGDVVQTSRGAVVPLAHAARFVALAKRAASRGGAEWADGAGPIVGHFRAQRIGADLSAVIGCHYFTPEESTRAIAAIETAAAARGIVSETAEA